MWLGGTDVTEEGKYVWESSKQVLTFFDWSSGEPNDANAIGFEDCMQLSFSDWKWNDVFCTLPYLATMCEIIFPCY
jgi:hypothetical protein